MSDRILIIGEPGSGKTASIRNLPPEQTFYVDADQKGLCWQNWRKDYSVDNHNYARTNDHEKVQALINNVAEKGTDIHYIVVDTLNALMIHDEMTRAKEKNFDRWMDLATCVYNMVSMAGTYRDDLTVIFTGHTQTERDDSGYTFTRMKTSGKKLDKICLESLFNVVLISKVIDGEYVFETQANNSTARTPMGAFTDMTIPNDITAVINVLKNY
ncbi:MAG: ATP-binding protein [Bacteroidales bacterium]|nr:ATP-binding protein [Bacteroidales bacterium]